MAVPRVYYVESVTTAGLSGILVIVGALWIAFMMVMGFLSVILESRAAGKRRRNR